jgi:hypothetical protein
VSRFDCAAWRPVANQGGPLDANLGLVLHHAVATGSLYTWFNNPSSGVSAHFWVSQSGHIEQYVDTDRQAWHAMTLNARYVGVETEGCSAPPHADPMSDAMVDALARLYAEGYRRHGWPNALAEADGQPGFGYHRMAVATACPCDVRLAERPNILAKAFAGGPPAPPGTSPPSAPPAASAPPWPGRYLSYPPIMQGSDVHTWQAQMAARGWPLTVDGAYGAQSAHTCADFQAEKGLAADGIVGPETWAATWEAPVT